MSRVHAADRPRRRRRLRTVAVILSGGVLALALYRMMEPKLPAQTKQSVEAAFGIQLPVEARDIRFARESAMNVFLFARFDCSAASIEQAIMNSKYPLLLTVSPSDPEQLQEMRNAGGPAEWWVKDGERVCGFARSITQYSIGGSAWRRTVSVCVVDISSDMRRAYLLRTEEPCRAP